ncbi:YwiC-like family protein, partial [Dermatophilus congolensis]|nr:YwiC-like family protein [Dermatophilus congolensis]
MSTARAHTPKRPRRRSTAWIPRQHGAWAILTVPITVGVIRSHGHPTQLPLIAFCFTAYLTYNAFSTWTTSRHNPRHLPPLLTYTTLATTLALTTLITRPDLAHYTILFIPLTAITTWCTLNHHERWLLNDITTITTACLFGYIVYMAGFTPTGTIGVGRAKMATATILLIAYFTGTALYIKTIIRERTSRPHHIASITYHATCTTLLATALLLGPTGIDILRLPGLTSRGTLTATIIFLLLTIRATALAGHKIRPTHAGLGELAASALLTITTTAL